MAPLREEGIAAVRETVNKVCREGKLCPCQHSVLVSLSLSFLFPLSAFLQRIKKRKRGVFKKQTEQTGASAWIQLDWEMTVQTVMHYLTPLSVRQGGEQVFVNCGKRLCKNDAWNMKCIVRFAYLLNSVCSRVNMCVSVYLNICQATGVGQHTGQDNISVFYSCFKDTHIVSKLTYTVETDLHFLPLMM